MLRHSFFGCSVILLLAMLAPYAPAQKLGARLANARRAPVKTVAYTLPRHLQQYANPVAIDEHEDSDEETITDIDVCSDPGCDDPACAQVVNEVEIGVGCSSSSGCTSLGVCGSGCTSGGCTSLGVDCGSGCGPITCAGWSAGVEFTLVKPYFDDNAAFTTSDTNDADFETLTDTSFDWDLEFAPRVWIEMLRGNDCGIRITYWQFDYGSANASGSPPANGFGSITHAPFGDVDLSTTTPDSVFSAGSDLNAYTIDFEATKSFGGGTWGLVTAAGWRFGEIEQRYRATLQNAQGLQQGSINYSHQVQGFGPTVGLRVQRPYLMGFSVFGVARGSLLYGDGESTLTAIEDEDLANAFTTRHIRNRDDLLPIGELQVGLLWTPLVWGVWQPYMHVAFEAQHWSGAGNAYSEDGNLGFYGVNWAFGVGW